MPDGLARAAAGGAVLRRLPARLRHGSEEGVSGFTVLLLLAWFRGWYKRRLTGERGCASGVQTVSKTKTTPPAFDTFSELWEALGKVPLERIRMQPPPGTATEEDVIHAESRYNRLCELIDGTLVEKTVGFYESRVALVLGRILDEFAVQHCLGFVIGPDGMLRVEPSQVRLPDVSFFSWGHFPDRLFPKGTDPRPGAGPGRRGTEPQQHQGRNGAETARILPGRMPAGLALNRSGAEGPARRPRCTAALTESRLVREKGNLDGGDVLPGFEQSLAGVVRANWPAGSKTERRCRRDRPAPALPNTAHDHATWAEEGVRDRRSRA